MRGRPGFTLVELLVVIGIIATLIGLLVPALQGAKRRAQSLQDTTQIREIHKGMLVFANDNEGTLPTPGLINRKADRFLNQQVAGTGPEDHEKNTSANMYSAMVAQRLITEDILISPAEVNPRIPDPGQREYVYDYSAYQPANDVYWDGDVPTGDAPSTDRFRANIQDGESHTSYYHLGLAGPRKRVMWRAEAGATTPLVSSRAPYRGRGEDVAAEEYERSWTLLLHGSRNAWAGVAVFGDNHTDDIQNFTPENAFYLQTSGDKNRDNIFDIDENPGQRGEVFLAMSRSADADEVVDYEEELRPD